MSTKLEKNIKGVVVALNKTLLEKSKPANDTKEIKDTLERQLKMILIKFSKQLTPGEKKQLQQKCSLLQNVKGTSIDAFSGLFDGIKSVVKTIKDRLSSDEVEKKSVKVSGIVYKSLIEPRNNDIEHVLFDVKTNNYGLANSLREVDDVFARIKVGEKMKKDHTYEFSQEITNFKKTRS
jgi:hypothetical protein